MENMRSSTLKEIFGRRETSVSTSSDSLLKSRDSEGPATFRPFLFGFSLAILLLSSVTIVPVLWVCREVDFTIEEEPCPQLLKVPQEKAGIFSRVFRKRKNYEYLVARPDPEPCTCRYLHQLVSNWGRPETTPGTCKPLIKDQGGVKSNASSSKSPLQTYKTAFTRENLRLSNDEKEIVRKLGQRVESGISDWKERTKQVPWGGSGTPWYSVGSGSGKTDLEKLDGGSLFYSYLRIMKWPKNLQSKFPFKLCAKGCKSEESLRHTLEFREKYKPWLVSPSTRKENSNGCIYHRGFSPSIDGENGSHALVWMRPGNRVKVDDVALTRAFVNSLEIAVASSLERSNGRVGKFNVVVDGNNFSWGISPSVHQLKAFVLMLQDHFPDRLGVLLLTNIGRVGEMVVGIIKPLISEEVRQKIFVLPKTGSERQVILESVIGLENVPRWLGGQDSFEFDPSVYYSQSGTISNEDAAEYLTTMPYHA